MTSTRAQRQSIASGRSNCRSFTLDADAYTIGGVSDGAGGSGSRRGGRLAGTGCGGASGSAMGAHATMFRIDKGK
ncbi:MAG: hypothetical protein IPM54_06960 [Polyangiaceae bacterium]|nr:hypothetical protein [Polyangiaceae bacterium]